LPVRPMRTMLPPRTSMRLPKTGPETASRMTTMDWLYLISPHQFRIGSPDVVRIDLGGILREAGFESPGGDSGDGAREEFRDVGDHLRAGGQRAQEVFELHDDLGSHQAQIRVVDRAEYVAAPRVDHRGSQRVRPERGHGLQVRHRDYLAACGLGQTFRGGQSHPDSGKRSRPRSGGETLDVRDFEIVPRQQRLDLGEHDMRKTIGRMHSDFFQNLFIVRQRDAAEFTGGIDRQQQSSSHGPNRYTLSVAYALPLALRIDTRRLSVPGILCTISLGMCSVPSRPVPATRKPSPSSTTSADHSTSSSRGARVGRPIFNEYSGGSAIETSPSGCAISNGMFLGLISMS